MNAERWRAAENVDPSLNQQAEEAAGFLRKPDKIVCDLGSGPNQFLRTLIGARRKYLPADLQPWTPDTEVCDLNAGRYPAALSKADVCFMLGVIEYIKDVPGLFRQLSKRVPRAIVSYCSVDHHARKDDWMNCYFEAELIEKLQAAGYLVEKRKLGRQKQTLIRAVLPKWQRNVLKLKRPFV